MSFSSEANMDCIYTGSKSGITISYTSPCFSEKYQSFIDSFLNKLLLKVNNFNSGIEILVLVNYEQLYYDNSANFANFISVGFDTLRPMNSNYIIDYFYDHYSTTAESRLNPPDINFTDKKEKAKKGIKIIYNYDYRLGPPVWSEIEKLIIYAKTNFQTIKLIQKIDTVRHFSCYVTMPKLDSFAVNKILGKEELITNRPEKTDKFISNFWLILLLGIGLSITVAKLINKHSS
jgi:hypothetical protein